MIILRPNEAITTLLRAWDQARLLEKDLVKNKRMTASTTKEWWGLLNNSLEEQATGGCNGATTTT